MESAYSGSVGVSTQTTDLTDCDKPLDSAGTVSCFFGRNVGPKVRWKEILGPATGVMRVTVIGKGKFLPGTGHEGPEGE